MMRTSVWSTTLLALVLAGCASGPEPAAAPPPAVTPAPAAALDAALDAALAGITAEESRAHVAFLASDELRGRATPSPGLEQAAAYLADELRGMGLEGGAGGGFLQPYPVQSVTLEPAGIRLTAQGVDGPALAYARDFFAFPADVDSITGPATYVGLTRALMAEDVPDLTGRIAVAVLDLQSQMDLINAPRRAAEAGAIGVLLVLPPLVPPQAVPAIADQVTAVSLEIPVPTFGILWSQAKAILSAAAAVLDDPAPDAAVALDDVRLTLVAAAERDEAQVPNVVALLPGSDPALRDEYVLLTAHFDHVGVGEPDADGDSIYNGADDDASGTALVLEVAEAFASLPEPPARSIVFLLVSGEEKGLLGSRWWAENPTVPIGDVVANVNMDMVGRNAPDTVVAIGQEYTSLGPLAHRIAREYPALGLTIAQDPNPAEQAFFRSDHVAFMRKDVPAIFLTTWLHDDYHQPSDEVDAIDADKLARVGRLVFLMAHEAANANEPPSWTGDSREEVREVLKGSPF